MSSPEFTLKPKPYVRAVVSTLSMRPSAIAALCIVVMDLLVQFGLMDWWRWGLAPWVVVCIASGLVLLGGLLARDETQDVWHAATFGRVNVWAKRVCERMLPYLLIGVFAPIGYMAASTRGTDFLLSKEACEFEGVITGVSKRDSMRVKVTLQSDAFVSQSVDGQPLIVQADIPAPLLAAHDGPLCGMRVHARGMTKIPYPDPFSDFDYLEYLTEQGISALVGVERLTILPPSADWSIATLAGVLNERFAEALRRSGVSEANVDFLRALVLADRSELPADVRNAFSACGTSHVLAVSGLHVGVLSGLVVRLLRHFVSRGVAAMLSLPLIWIYVLVCGASPSIVRAAIMFSFLTVEMSRKELLPEFQALAAALAVILVVDPPSIFSTSLWLSFAAVGGIVAIKQMLDRYTMFWPKLKKKFFKALVISLVSQLATLPALIYVFHSVPLYFWVNNLVVVEPIGWVFSLALMCQVVYVVPLLGSVFGWCADALLNFLTGYCRVAASVPLATIDRIPCGVGEFVALSALVLAIFYMIRRREDLYLNLKVRWGIVAATVMALVVAIGHGCGVRGGGAVEPFAYRGVAGVVVADGRGEALFLVDRADLEGAPGVARRMSEARGWESWSVEAGVGLCEAEMCGRRYAIVSSADGVGDIPPCDVCIVNCSAEPIPTGGAELVFTENCENWPLWGRD